MGFNSGFKGLNWDEDFQYIEFNPVCATFSEMKHVHGRRADASPIRLNFLRVFQRMHSDRSRLRATPVQKRWGNPLLLCWDSSCGTALQRTAIWQWGIGSMRKGKTGDATKARRLKSASLYKLSNCRQINTPLSLSLSLSLSLYTAVSTPQSNPCKYYSSVHPWHQELQLLKLKITTINDI